VTVYRRNADRGLVPMATLNNTEDVVLRTPLLPGFTLTLAKLFA